MSPATIDDATTPSAADAAEFDIAVIGMAAVFPGSPDIDALWAHLLAGTDLITRGAPDPAAIDPRLLADPDIVFAAGRLAGAKEFDADFFGYSAQTASYMDPQQRKFLEVCWHALEDAGAVPDPQPDPGEPDTARIGVYVGSGQNRYLLSHIHPRLAGDRLAVPAALLGNLDSGVATRVSYELGLSGPALTIRTACSTSLVAIHTACQDLLSYGCDAALAGGVTIDPAPVPHYRYIAGAPLSSDGRCRPFDAEAEGTVPADGAGAVVLKRLSDALADGDRIRAVIKGSAVNNDGRRKAGFTAPSSHGQREVVLAAQAVAGVDPGAIGFIEAHGTATPVGDPLEVRALTEAFGTGVAPTGRVLLGAVKGNIGHTDAAAGVAGFIKAVLAVESGTVPPTANFRTPNPLIDFGSSPFHVNAEPAAWPVAGARLAGVSSFGIGGTNAHIVLGTAPEPPPSRGAGRHQVITVSARGPAALDALTDRVENELRAVPGITADQLADTALSLSTGRGTHAYRRALHVVAGAQVAVHPAGPAVTTPTQSPAPVVFALPGNGGHDCSGIHELYTDNPLFRAAFDECGAAYARYGPGDDLLERVTTSGVGVARRADFPPSGAGLLAVEYALARTLIGHGVLPAAMIGYSAGEYTAAVLAGVVDIESGIRLALARGEVLAAAPAGATVSVLASPEQLRPLLDFPEAETGPEIAGFNGPEWCTVSGDAASIERFEHRLARAGIDFNRLPIDSAAHSALLEPELPRFTDLARTIDFRAPAIPYVSTLTGTWITADEATDPRYWTRHIRQPVNFDAGLATVLGAEPALVLEIGPGSSLTSLISRHPKAGDTAGIAATQPATAAGHRGLLMAFGRAWEHGITVRDLPFSAGQRTRVAVPGYPFQRTEYWIEEAPTADNTGSDTGTSCYSGWRTAAHPAAANQAASALVIDLGDGPIDAGAVARRALDALAAAPGERRPIVLLGSGLHDLAAMDFATTEALTVEALAVAVSATPGCAHCLFLDLHGIEDSGDRAAIVAAETAAGGGEPVVVRTPAQRWVRRHRPLPAASPSPRLARFSAQTLHERQQIARYDETKAVEAMVSAPPAPSETAINELCRLLIHDYLATAGIDAAVGTRISRAGLYRALGLEPRWERFVSALLGVLATDGDLELDTDGVVFLREAPSRDRAAQVGSEIARDHPEAAREVDMLTRITAHYPQVFAGRIDPKEVLFPGGDVGRMRELLDRKLADTFLTVYQPMLIDLVSDLAQRASRPLRILEIGAGRGHLTWPLIEALRAAGPVEYHVTDIGRAFVVEAQARAQEAGHSGLEFGILDIATDPAGQGYAPGSFDVVVALNVIHAVPDLRGALHNAIELLAPGGVFGFLEGYRMPRPAVLAVGLYEGWWYFDDGIRQDSPLVGPDAWTTLLAEFHGVTVTAYPADAATVERADTALYLVERDRNSPAVPDDVVVVDTTELPDPLDENWWAAWHTDHPAAKRIIFRSPEVTATDADTLGRAARRTAEISHACLSRHRAGDTRWTHLVDADSGVRAPGGEPEAVVRIARTAQPTADVAASCPAPGGAVFNRRPDLDTPYSAPRDDTERVIAEIWCGVIGLDQVGVHDDFVSLGGESLLVMQITSRIRQKFGIRIAMSDVFESRTVAALATMVGARRTEVVTAPGAIPRSSRRDRRVVRTGDGALHAVAATDDTAGQGRDLR